MGHGLYSLIPATLAVQVDRTFAAKASLVSQALPQETGLDFRKHYAKALYKFLSGRQLRGKWGGSNQGMLETDRGLCRVESPKSELKNDKKELLMRLISFHSSMWRFLDASQDFFHDAR